MKVQVIGLVPVDFVDKDNKAVKGLSVHYTYPIKDGRGQGSIPGKLFIRDGKESDWALADYEIEFDNKGRLVDCTEV